MENIQTKLCSNLKCNTKKPISEFSRNKNCKDGLLSICKDCSRLINKIYVKTEEGVISTIYNTQLTSSKHRRHIPPNYSKEELREWLYINGFRALFDDWADSGYKKRMKPSCDRLDDNKGYSLDRLRLVTWGENKDKQSRDILLARSTSGKICKAVEQFTKEGISVAKFISLKDANRKTGIDFRMISRVCRGQRLYTGGYIWKFIAD